MSDEAIWMVLLFLLGLGLGRMMKHPTPSHAELNEWASAANRGGRVIRQLLQQHEQATQIINAQQRTLEAQGKLLAEQDALLKGAGIHQIVRKDRDAG